MGNFCAILQNLKRLQLYFQVFKYGTMSSRSWMLSGWISSPHCKKTDKMINALLKL